MRRLTPLIAMADPAIFGSGLAPDLHPVLVQLWERADGVKFVNGKMLHQKEPQLAFSLTGGPPLRGIGQMQISGGTRYVFAGAGLNVWRWYGPAAVIAATFATQRVDDSGSSLSTWYDYTRWGDWMVICNGVDNPVIDKIATSVVIDLSPTPPLTMAKKFDFLVGIGMGTSGTEISWCNQGNIENWTQGEGKTAGTMRLEELDTPIRASATLGTYIAVYGVDQMILVSYVGAPFYFGQKFGLDGIGATGKMAVCSNGRMNYGVSRNGVWQTDGATFNYIDEGVLREYLQNNVNWLQAGKIVAFKNDDSGCFEFHFPMGTSLVNNEAWSYDPRGSGSWSKCVAYNVAQERRVLEAPLVGTVTGDIFLLDYQDRAPAGSINVRTKPMSVNGTHQDLYMDEVQLLTKRADGVQFRIGVAEDFTAAYIYTDWYDFGPSMFTQVLNVAAGQQLPTGTYFVLELRNLVEARLDLQGFVIYGIADGMNRNAA